MKHIRFFLYENFQFLEGKFSIYLNRRVFVMVFSFNVRTFCIHAKLSCIFNVYLRSYIPFKMLCNYIKYLCM